MFAVLSANGYVDYRIQIRFLKLSGTFEHTAQLANVMNIARNKQRSVVLTLLHLKNAFGKVIHNVITEILIYCHIPDQKQCQFLVSIQLFKHPSSQTHSKLHSLQWVVAYSRMIA